MQEYQDYVVLYHGGCNDGSGAAWAAYCQLGDDATYLPYYYGSDHLDISDRIIFMVDVSADRKMTQHYLDRNNVVVVIDHHESTFVNHKERFDIEDFAHLQNLIETNPNSALYFYVDKNKSGSVLTWEFFTCERDSSCVPKQLLLIQEYDIRKFLNFSDSMIINAWLDLDRSIENVGKIIDKNNSINREVYVVGSAILKHNQSIVRTVTKNYQNKVIIDGVEVITINGPHFLRNEIADELFVNGAKAVIVYNHRENKTVYSIRGNGEFDCVKLAAKYGGGGHRNAAAWSIPGPFRDIFSQKAEELPSALATFKTFFKQLISDLSK